MVGMWLAKQLIDDDDVEAQEHYDAAPRVPSTSSSTDSTSKESSENQESSNFFSDLQKMGGQLFTEGGTFLSEMNDTVFNGAVGELLAPADSLEAMQGVGVTVGVLGSSEVDHDEAIAAVAHYLARKGYNLITSGPIGMCRCACESFINTDDRKGRCVGIFAMKDRKHKARQGDQEPEGGLCTLVDISVFGSDDNLLESVAKSADILIIFPGDDDFLLSSLEKSNMMTSQWDTPCVVFGLEADYQKWGGIFQSSKFVSSAEDVARFIAASTQITSEGHPTRQISNPSVHRSSVSTVSSPTSSLHHTSANRHADTHSTSTTVSPSTTTTSVVTMKMSAITSVDVHPTLTQPQPNPTTLSSTTQTREKERERQREGLLNIPIDRPDSKGRVSPLTLDDLASYELIESPAKLTLSSRTKPRSNPRY